MVPNTIDSEDIYTVIRILQYDIFLDVTGQRNIYADLFIID